MARAARFEQSCLCEVFVDSSQLCPLCEGRATTPFFQDKHRRYWQCELCRLVFVPACYHLSRHAEQAEYQKHENSFADAGYRQFLSRAAEPLLAQLAPASRGIDIGCGPAPVLAQMLQQAGHHCDYYDPLFYPQPPPQGHYHFITLTEVAEHMAAPRRDLLPLNKHIAPGGWLLVMTKRVINAERFANWHYKNDPTHISFYSAATLHWLADYWRVKWRSESSDVALFGPF